MRERRTFNAEFKLQVVQMIRVRGLSAGAVCSDMQLDETAVRRWLPMPMKRLQFAPVSASPHR